MSATAGEGASPAGGPGATAAAPGTPAAARGAAQGAGGARGARGASTSAGPHPAPAQPERITLFRDGEAQDFSDDLGSALEAAKEARCWVWIEVSSPDHEQWASLSALLGLNRLAVEDMQEQSQRTKLEQYGAHAFMVLHPASYNDATEQITLGECDVYLGRDFLLTHRTASTPAPDAPLERVKHSPALIALGPRGAGYALLDDVVDGYQPVLDGLSKDIDEIDDELFSASETDTASRIYRLSRQVSRFQQAVAPLDTVLTSARKSLSGTDPELLLASESLHSAEPVEAPGRAGLNQDGAGHERAQDPDREPLLTDASHRRRRALLVALLRDVQDHARRIESHLNEMHQTLGNALSLAMTLASERSTAVSLEQNDQTKKISSWAAIFAAPTVLAGVWGMNFAFMPELDWTWGYPVALATMVVVSGALYRAFKKRNWL